MENKEQFRTLDTLIATIATTAKLLGYEVKYYQETYTTVIYPTTLSQMDTTRITFYETYNDIVLRTIIKGCAIILSSQEEQEYHLNEILQKL